MRRAAALVVGLVVLIALAGYPVFVRPQIDTVRKADAIVVLGGSQSGARYRYGLDLARDGWAPTLVLSNPFARKEPFVTGLCETPQHRFRIECFIPDPRTTLGEGREVRRLADERNWDTVIIVTSVPHVSRARYIVGKCFGGALIMAASPAHLGVLSWATMYVYQTAGYLKSAVLGEC
jgi:uncharacterized SAM-binding protein YcdF (DUF218 family)